MDSLLIEIHAQLGITQKHIDANRLHYQEQPPLEKLEIVDFDFEGRAFILSSVTAQAWRKMTQAALGDQIQLMPFSGFRSYQLQKSLIEKHLKNGRAIEDILTHIAIPGFSEHHTGRAIDIHSRLEGM